jgi:hypothetical protein
MWEAFFGFKKTPFPDLTRQHLKVLIDLIPRLLQRSHYPPMGPNVPPLGEGVVQQLMWDRRPRITPQGDDLLALQMLHAYGLVEEFIKSSIEEPRIPVMINSESQLRSAVKDFANSLANPEITRSFSLSPLGNEFLKFVGLPKETRCPAATERHGADGQ